jgi:hypothetical protein
VEIYNLIHLDTNTNFDNYAAVSRLDGFIRPWMQSGLYRGDISSTPPNFESAHISGRCVQLHVKSFELLICFPQKLVENQSLQSRLQDHRFKSRHSTSLKVFRMLASNALAELHDPWIKRFEVKIPTSQRIE